MFYWWLMGGFLLGMIGGSVITKTSFKVDLIEAAVRFNPVKMYGRNYYILTSEEYYKMKVGE